MIYAHLVRLVHLIDLGIGDLAHVVVLVPVVPQLLGFQQAINLKVIRIT